MVYDMDLIEPMQKVSVSHKLFISVQSLIDFPITALAYIHMKTFVLSLTQLFELHSHGPNQLLQLREDITVTPEDLLTMPAVS